MMSKQNSAVDNFRSAAEIFDLEVDCYTIHQCLNLDIDVRRTKNTFEMTEYDYIVIDEIFMTDKPLIRIL